MEFHPETYASNIHAITFDNHSHLFINLFSSFYICVEKDFFSSIYWNVKFGHFMFQCSEQKKTIIFEWKTRSKFILPKCAIKLSLCLTLAKVLWIENFHATAKKNTFVDFIHILFYETIIIKFCKSFANSSMHVNVCLCVCQTPLVFS